MYDNEVATVAPPSRPERLVYADLPPAVRARVEGWLGEVVTAAHPVDRGFSPGLVGPIDTAGGRRFFIKSVAESVNQHSATLYRAEIDVCRAVAQAVSGIPRLLWSDDADGWVTLVFEYVDGRPPALPWEDGELRRVIEALEDFADLMTPPPVPLRDMTETYADEFVGWRSFAELPDGHPTLLALDPWALQRLEQLAGIESTWSDSAEPRALLHGDLRSDNLLLTEDRVVLVDWPWACTGPAWYDLMSMLPSVRIEGGPEPWTIFDRSRPARSADPAAVTAVLAALAGFFAWNSLLPPPPALPTLRQFQAQQGEVALDWLKHRWR